MKSFENFDYQGCIDGIQITDWNSINALAEQTFKENDGQVEFKLIHTGANNKITYVKKSNLDDTTINNKVPFKVVKYLFIRDLIMEKISKMVLVKNEEIYRAHFILKDNPLISKYTFATDNPSTFKTFINDVNRNSITEDEDLYDIDNMRLHEMSQKAVFQLPRFMESKKRVIRKSFKSLIG